MLGKRIPVVLYLLVWVNTGRFQRVDVVSRSREFRHRAHDFQRAPWGLSVQERLVGVAKAEGTDDFEGGGDLQKLRDLRGVADTRVPNRCQSPQVGTQGHVVDNGSGALHDRELVVVPAFVEGNDDDTGRLFEVIVRPRDPLQFVLSVLIMNTDKMMHLVVTRRRGLDTVGYDFVNDILGQGLICEPPMRFPPRKKRQNFRSEGLGYMRVHTLSFFEKEVFRSGMRLCASANLTVPACRTAGNGP